MSSLDSGDDESTLVEGYMLSLLSSYPLVVTLMFRFSNGVLKYSAPLWRSNMCLVCAVNVKCFVVVVVQILFFMIEYSFDIYLNFIFIFFFILAVVTSFLFAVVFLFFSLLLMFFFYFFFLK